MNSTPTVPGSAHTAPDLALGGAITARARLLHTHAHNPPYYMGVMDRTAMEGRMRRMTRDLILAGHPDRWREAADDLQAGGTVDGALMAHLEGAAMLYQVTPDMEDARARMQEALLEREGMGTPELVASTLVNLAEADLAERDMEGAWDLLERAYRLAPMSMVVHVNRRTVAQCARNEEWIMQAQEDLATSMPDWRGDAVLTDHLDSMSVHLVSLL